MRMRRGRGRAGEGDTGVDEFQVDGRQMILKRVRFGRALMEDGN